ncbi:MAG: aminopeptidase P family protein [Candidatus Aminicenantes bacterium]|nr:aminopeptidase P family protein [Candidatus Aminicenantes bacterium]
MFDKKTYIERRNRLRKKNQSGLALFLGNEESPMNYADNPYHYRQDSSFLYFFGLGNPGLAGVIDFDDGRDYIYGNDLTIEDIVWMGTQPTIRERSLRVGVENTGSIAQLEEILKKAMAQGRKIHFLPPYRPENKLKLFNWLGIDPVKTADNASVELIKAVVEQRAVKSDEEIDQIEDAVNISVDMHLTAMKMIRPGITEAEVAAAVHRVALAAGGQLSFPIIATINGQTLHNHYHGNTLKSGDMFLLDAGAENAIHYAGDLSSTIPVDATFTDRQKEIYNIALKSHEAAIAALKPGVKNLDVHLLGCKTIAEGMKDIGLMKGNVDDAVREGAHALFFPCGLGHMMGLDVHDMEDLGEVYVGYEGKPKSAQFGLKSLRLARELQPGFVITVEPGIYFIPELIDLWKSEKKFSEFINYDRIEAYKTFGGIRNEEDFLITVDGFRLLGKPLPKTTADVEAAKG